jgi:hypothetical protein
VVDESQLGSVETILRAALDGMNSRRIHYRLIMLENKLRRKNSRLQAEREKTRELKAKLKHRSPKPPKRKIPAGDLPLGLPES